VIALAWPGPTALVLIVGVWAIIERHLNADGKVT
jgi:hypothetical protein